MGIERYEDKPNVRDLINKNIGRNKWKWLEKQGVQLALNELDTDKESYKIMTKNAEYIGLLNLPKKHQNEIDFIYKHRLTQLQSLSMAQHGKLSKYGCNPISIGFSEKEQAWYGWTHRGYGKFYIGYEIRKDSIMDTPKTPYPYKVETLEQAKQLAIYIADYLD